ncbi:MAG: type II toxin-antitoxin system death-on-curing family toxin, partial [Sphingorhabdus sp.]
EGVRDATLLESAMARPQNLSAYGEPDAAALAAAYAYGIARNHPFVDGNKRTAAVVSETFLALNGFALTATDAELVVAFVDLAAGELSEAELESWFREFVRAV